MPKQTFFNLPDDKREHILACAVDEFAEKGYKQASISRMVAMAGIAKGSFYQYFEDKDDLFAHIVTTMIAERKLTTYEKERKRLEDLSLTGFLRVVFLRLVEDFQARPQLLKIGVELLQLTNDPIYKRIMGQYQESVNTYFLPFIQHEVEQGEIDPRVNASLLNFMLVSVGQYLSYVYASEGRADISAESINRLTDDLEFILTHGIYTEAGRRAN